MPTVKLDSKFFKNKYASPYIVDVKNGEVIEFITDSTKGFEILIDSSDGMFGKTNPVKLHIDYNNPGQTPAIKITKDLEKYYSVYSNDTGEYANYPCCSPPKIVGM